MEKTYIKCSYSEKDEAKALGAKWDTSKKQWYFHPELVRRELFCRWLPDDNVSDEDDEVNDVLDDDSEANSLADFVEADPEESDNNIDGDSDSDVYNGSKGVNKRTLAQLLKDEETDDEEFSISRRISFREQKVDKEEEEDIDGDCDESDEGGGGNTLWCSVCGEDIHTDSFSAKQQKVDEDEERFCLRHTGTSGYGRSYKRPQGVRKLTNGSPPLTLRLTSPLSTKKHVVKELVVIDSESDESESNLDIPSSVRKKRSRIIEDGDDTDEDMSLLTKKKEAFRNSKAHNEIKVSEQEPEGEAEWDENS